MNEHKLFQTPLVFKTKFEKYATAVLKQLKRLGVDTEKYIGKILDIITDYYDEVDTDYAAQCIKFELTRNFGSEKVGLHGIRESVGSDIDTFIDNVLDALDLQGSKEVYDYYNKNRDEIAPFYNGGKTDPIDAADELIKFFENSEEEETDTDPEAAAMRRENDKYTEDVMKTYNSQMKNPNFVKLRELHRSGDILKNPNSADGQWATPDYPISYAISENDVETLKDYLENGVPSSLVTGDEEDSERIPFEQQVNTEFVQDFTLLTKNVALEGKSIDEALDFMDRNVENFIISPYDLYNIFAAKSGNDHVLYNMIINYDENTNSEEADYFEVPLEDLVKYAQTELAGMTLDEE